MVKSMIGGIVVGTAHDVDIAASSGLIVQLTIASPRFGSSHRSRIRRWQYCTLSPSPKVSVT